MNHSSGVKSHGGGYFKAQSRESNKMDAVDQLQNKVKARLLEVETEMARIGKEWVSFGSALQNPKNYTFDVTNAAITLDKSSGGLRRPLGRLTPEDTLDWEKFTDLLDDYREATEQKAKLTARLSGAGLPVQ
jgi:hypothetical protein